MGNNSLVTYLTSFIFGVVGATVVFAALIIWGLRSSPKQKLPIEIQELVDLIPKEWELVSWNRQCMGWLVKLVVQGRRFDVSSHRGYVEISEICAGGQREIRSDESEMSPKQIYEFIAKTVA